MLNIWLLSFCLAVDVLSKPLSPLPILVLDPHEADNSTALLQTLTESASSSRLNAHQCFDQRQPYDIQMKPVSYWDCVEAARRIAYGSKAHAPMHFSRDPNVGMELPESWSYGSCVIRLDVKGAEDEDTFNMILVANAASLIAERCSAKTPSSPGLGGLGLIGPKKVVLIFIYGRTPPPPPKPRPTVLSRVETS
ncbi:MAG: hypothetical protein Q9218_007375 [Villophora microphyllina]